ncbi:integrin-linked kinase-associated serine/threonine phosphatase 2C isoform X2 [Oryzias latipes]|uniref:integrin-linked kinase-associated serine/threonine phosphatase 2C isoform X2 n=1 Tax=Oryzias latipes TaxID=8090 RepID=UPI0005CC2908|nr:integrin-linked kinase-associated serine/threonine phosphatase 2C isoform X2 [Oryzias latipes]
MDLFDDLPEPTQTSGRLSAPSASDEEEERTAKRRREDGGEDVEVKRVCLPELKAYVAARRGEREEMQDAHVLLPDLMGFLPSQPELVSRLSYFAVFDGHGGARASRFAAEHLHHNLAKKFPPTGDAEHLDKLIRKCLLDTFRQTDEDFLKKASSQKPSWKDGSTATCVLVVDDVLYVANLGDSRAVMCRTEAAADGQQKLLALALSKEHNPTIYEERMRIQRAGGTVRDGRVLGVLEVSRSIGDGQYKRCGVISTPDLRRCQLTANDRQELLIRYHRLCKTEALDGAVLPPRFILLACDGLFKVFSADEALRFVLNVLQEAGVEQKAGLTEEELRFEAACQQLASEAVKRGCADNVTVILVSIGC